MGDWHIKASGGMDTVDQFKWMICLANSLHHTNVNKVLKILHEQTNAFIIDDVLQKLRGTGGIACLG